jgi:hypothetical protein
MESKQSANANLGASCTVDANKAAHLDAKINQRYKVECFGRDGKLKWREEFDNLVVTAGRNKYLDATLKTGLTTPAWYVGLKGAGTIAAADTMASHAGWTESAAYSQSTRPVWTAGTIASGSVDNSGAVAVFSINATATIAGAFLADNSTKSGSTGTLLGAGDFSASRSLESGDTLNVTVTCSLTSS